MGTAFVAYMLGMCWLVTILGPASYERYMNTSTLAWFALLCMMVITTMDSESVNKNMFATFAALGMVCVMSVFPLAAPKVPSLIMAEHVATYEAESIIKDYIKNDGKRVNLFLSQSLSYGELKHHRTYLSLIDENIFVKNYHSETIVQTIAKTAEEAQADWSKTLIDGNFEYMFIQNFDELFVKQFAPMFENGAEDIEAGACFKVVQNGSQVTFVK